MPSEPQVPSVKYGTTTIDYKIEVKKRLKNTYINVDKNGVLVKTNESTSAEQVEQYVLKKASWIVKHLQGYKKSYDTEIVTGSRLYYLGKSYYVELLTSNVNKVSVSFTHSKFKITVPLKCNQVAINVAIEAFYKEKAAQKITPLIKRYSKIMDVTPQHLSFRKADKRWGSCSASNRISFNYHLVKINSALIEYVVIHELTHIRHKNHSKAFWMMVQKYLPDYKVKEESIKRFEKFL